MRFSYISCKLQLKMAKCTIFVSLFVSAVLVTTELVMSTLSTQELMDALSANDDQNDNDVTLVEVASSCSESERIDIGDKLSRMQYMMNVSAQIDLAAIVQKMYRRAEQCFPEYTMAEIREALTRVQTDD